MKNKRNILCGAFAVLALSLAGGSLAFTANAEETATKTLADISIGMVKGASMRIGSAEEGNTEETPVCASPCRYPRRITKLWIKRSTKISNGAC